MKSFKKITLTFVISLSILFSMLSWGGVQFYHFEKQRLVQKTELIIKKSADSIQILNTTLGNIRHMMDDSERDSKIAFAVGMAGNMGKVRMYFKPGDRLITKADTTKAPMINKAYLSHGKISYKPSAVKTIHHFDTVFTYLLNKEKIVIRYKLCHVVDMDTVKLTHDYSSAPFVINFYDPTIYRVDYSIPAKSVIPGILPYLSISIILLLMVTGAFMFYYRSYKMQAQMAQFKESLFSNITHELKTPLSSLQLILDIAQSGETSILSKKHKDFATSEINRMKLIIDKILSFGKMSKEQFALNKERINLDSVITDAIHIMEISLHQAGGAIHYEAGNKIIITGDRTLLTNTFATIIDNAIKYNKDIPKINIELKAVDNNTVISISDNGTGIAPHYQKKIFDPFFRVPTGHRHDVKGHGLGLSFALQVTELHRGSIHVVSQPDCGSTFMIRIPL